MRLSEEQIEQRLSQLTSWKRELHTITKTFSFSNYMDGIQFVQQIAIQAEQLNHHPDLLIGYCKVTVQLTTHDVAGLSELDFQLAQTIDDLFMKQTGA